MRATNVGGSVTFVFLVSPRVEKVLVPNTPDEAWGEGERGIKRFIEDMFIHFNSVCTVSVPLQHA